MPISELDPRYGAAGAGPIPWADAEAGLRRAELFWVLHRVAAGFLAKYGEEWRFEVRDGLFHHGPGATVVYRVAPDAVFAFGKAPYSQTRYRFGVC